jgi:isopenicillin N synthase-like dioxygenase
VSHFDIPLIDIAPAFTGEERARRRVAGEINRACCETGFFVVCGHQVPDAVFDQAYARLAAFFALPLAHKQACRLPSGHTFARDEYTPYGYSALLEENAYAYMGEQGKPNDCVEKYSTGRLVLDDSIALPFPATAEGAALRAALGAFYAATDAVARELAGLFEIGLNLPPGQITGHMAASNDSLRCHAYPAREPGTATDQGMGAHRDGSLITLLSHTSPGIEVGSPDGSWSRLPCSSPRHYVVNIGDLLAHGSGGIYRSTPHRVVLAEVPRLSLVFFKLTDENELVEVGNRQMDALFGR